MCISQNARKNIRVTSYCIGPCKVENRNRKSSKMSWGPPPLFFSFSILKMTGICFGSTILKLSGRNFRKGAPFSLLAPGAKNHSYVIVFETLVILVLNMINWVAYTRTCTHHFVRHSLDLTLHVILPTLYRKKKMIANINISKRF